VTPLSLGSSRNIFPGSSGVRSEDAPSAPAIPVEARIAVDKDAKQTYLGLHFPLPPLSAKTYAMASLAEDMLGGGVGSLLWPLRTRDQLAYAVDSSFFHIPGGGVLSAFLETSPEKLERPRESLDGRGWRGP
jgi:predicted Zn-dependent peptidase